MDQITWLHEVQAQGDGYNGRYRFVGTYHGWTLMGPAGDYLTPGIGYPFHASTPAQLFEMVRANRKRVTLRLIEPEPVP